MAPRLFVEEMLVEMPGPTDAFFSTNAADCHAAAIKSHGLRSESPSTLCEIFLRDDWGHSLPEPMKKLTPLDLFVLILGKSKTASSIQQLLIKATSAAAKALAFTIQTRERRDNQTHKWCVEKVERCLGIFQHRVKCSATGEIWAPQNRSFRVLGIGDIPGQEELHSPGRGSNSRPTGTNEQ